MLYESKYTDFMVLVRSEAVMYHPATGVEIGRVKPLTVEFGTHSGEINIVNPITGQSERHALIHGRFYDTEEAKERLEWTDDEHESVVAALDKICRDQPYLCAKVELHTAEIVKPWPTYDETHWKTIPVLAEQLGLLELTLAYERAHSNRDSVIDPIVKRLEQEPESTELDVSSEELITLES